MGSRFQVSTLAAALCGLALAQAAQAQTRDFEVPAGDLSEALDSYVRQTGAQLIYRPDDVGSATTAGVRGALDQEVALERLLAGTGLVVQREPGGAVAIRRPVAAPPPPGAPAAPAAEPQESRPRNAPDAAPAPASATPVRPRGATAAETTLDQIEVTGRRVRMTEIGGYASTLRETPQSVTIVGREQIESQNLFTLDDVMLTTPGVAVDRMTSDEHYYYIRGEDVHSFQWDGITLESFPHLNTSPNMAMFEEVQVLRGANGVLNAAKSFGSINLIRKRPKEYHRASASLSYGSWSNFNADVDVTGPLTDSGRLRGRAVVSYGDRDYFYDVAGRKEKLFYGALEYDLAPGTLLTFTANEHHVSSTPYIYGLPRYTDGSSMGLPRSTFLGTDWTRFKAESTNWFASVEHRFDNGWSAKLAGTSLDSASAYKYAYVWGGVDRAIGQDFSPGTNLYGAASDWDFKQHAADLSVQGVFNLFGRQHELLVGGSYYVNYYGYGQASLPGLYQPRGINVWAWDPYAVPEPVTPPWQTVGTGWRDDWKGIYVTSRFHLHDAWTLTAGARATWYRHKFQQYDHGDPAAPVLVVDENSSEARVMTPYAGLVWDLTAAWSLYASYADMFTPQNVRTFEGRTLDPIIGANYELGVKGELLDGLLNASLAWFRVNKTNEAMEDTRYDPHDYDGRQFYLSTGKTRSEGYEVELSGRLSPNWSLSGGYTRNTTVTIRADQGVGLPYATWIPKHMLRAWTDYRLPFAGERWSVGGSLSMRSRVTRPSSVPAFISQGGYTVLGLRVGYRLTDAWDIALNVNNVTDKIYYLRTGNSVANTGLYGEPRNFMISLRGEL